MIRLTDPSDFLPVSGSTAADVELVATAAQSTF